MRLSVVNHTSYADAPVKQMYDAIGVQLFHFCNRWPGANIVVADLVKYGFYLELLDDLDEEGVLGYHDVDKNGRPYSKIAVNPSLNNGSDWLTGSYSVVSILGHEALETVGNPIINIWRDINPNVETAQEMCDAVEDAGYHHRGMDLTNFLLPSWFNPFGKPPYDYVRVLTEPFSMSAGGYMIVRSGGNISQEFGSSTPPWRRSAHARARLMGAN